MQLEADPVVPFSRERVFRAYRDHLPALVSYLPHVRSVHVESREEEGALVHLVNIWRAAGPIPEPIAKLLGEDILGWHDHATWDGSRWVCTWRIRSHALPEAVRCEGENRFVAIDAMRCRVQITGTLDIDLRRVTRLPERIAAPLARRIERYIVRQVAQNFLGVAEAVGRFLRAEPPSGSEEAPTDPGAPLL